MNYNDYSMFNRRKTSSIVPQGGQLFSAIGSVISSLVLAFIFLNLLFKIGLLRSFIGGYFDNFILVFVTAIGYNFFSNLVKSILIIICMINKKDYNTEPDYQRLFFKIDLFAGIAIILIMIISVITMLSNNVHNIYFNSWAMFIPYGIIAILGVTRIVKSLHRISLLGTGNLKNNDFNTTFNEYNTTSQEFAHEYKSTNSYTQPVNSAPQNNYQNTNTYNTQPVKNYENSVTNSTTKTNKFCSECGMKLQPDETVCPICQTKVK